MEKAMFRAVKEAVASVDFSEIEKRFNIKINVCGGGSFDPTEAGGGTFKIEAVPIVDGTAKPKGQLDFERYADQYGLEPSDFGRTFLSRGREFRISGLVTRRYKMPINAERVSDGKGYMFGADTVCRALGKTSMQTVIPRRPW